MVAFYTYCNSDYSVLKNQGKEMPLDKKNTQVKSYRTLFKTNCSLQKLRTTLAQSIMVCKSIKHAARSRVSLIPNHFSTLLIDGLFSFIARRLMMMCVSYKFLFKKIQK